MTTTTCGRCYPLDRCYCQAHAADLPEGSVVATDKIAWIREMAPTLMSYPWRGTNGGRFGNWRVDQALASGAQVLRVGNGKEG